MRIFNETQRFTQWFIWLPLALFLGILGYFCYQWFALGEAVGTVGPDARAEQLLIILFSAPVLLLFYSIKLKTLIDEKGIHYRFIPFHFSQKTILWSDMKICHVRQYSPIQEYGGWGYRFTFRNGRAYNIRGNKGIQIELATGKKILIGTQEATVVQQLIDRYKKGKKEKNERIKND